MKVQITSSGNIRVMGKRHVGDNKWSRFHKEVPIPSNHDTNRVTAKFENGTLFVNLPKVIVPAQPPPLEEAEKPTPEIPKPSKPRTEPQLQKIDQKKETVQKDTTTAEMTYQKEDTRAASQRKKSEGQDNKDNVISKKRQTVGDSANDGKKQKVGNEHEEGGDEQKPEIYKQILEKYVPKLKKPGNLTNLVLALLSVLVLILYAKNAITSTGKSHTKLFEDL